MVAQVEVPDGYRVVTLVGGESDGTPQIVQLDGTGRIVAVIQGEIEGITGPVDVSQTDSVRQIQGTDGSTLRTVKLDANGQIIMVPRGQSGHYMSVDASGFLTSVMKGDYTGTPTTLAVDSSGNIVAVIKGEYSGSLKTLATDADGRMVAVLTDPADIWGTIRAMGLAELAACLTPAKRFDRRGDIYHMDGFEDGTRGVSLDTSGAGSVCLLSCRRARTGAYSLKCTHGAATGRYAGFSTNVPHYTATKIGVEVSFTINAWLGYLQLYAVEYKDGTYYNYGLRWLASTGAIQYLAAGPTWTATDQTLALYVSDYCFNTAKLVFDTATHKYVRWQLNTATGSLAGISPASAALAVNDHVNISTYAYGTAAGATYIYVDDLIVTQNEPA